MNRLLMKQHIHYFNSFQELQIIFIIKYALSLNQSI